MNGKKYHFVLIFTLFCLMISQISNKTLSSCQKLFNCRFSKAFLYCSMVCTFVSMVRMQAFYKSYSEENKGVDNVSKMLKKHFEHVLVIANEKQDIDAPMIYVITPTYPRPEQIAELTKTAQTLMLVKNIFWIVVEDTHQPTPTVVEYLKSTSLTYVHLTARMPSRYSLGDSPPPKGVANRKMGIKWIQKNVESGVLYFADDDNTYDYRLFDDIRTTKKVSMIPVGHVGKYGISSPIVKNGSVIGFFDAWIAARKFAVDMAGFAINIQFMKRFPKANMPFKAGYEEDGFLRSLKLSYKDIEPKAENCTKIWVWHTQTIKRNLSVNPSSDFLRKVEGTNIAEILQMVHVPESIALTNVMEQYLTKLRGNSHSFQSFVLNNMTTS